MTHTQQTTDNSRRATPLSPQLVLEGKDPPEYLRPLHSHVGASDDLCNAEVPSRILAEAVRATSTTADESGNSRSSRRTGEKAEEEEAEEEYAATAFIAIDACSPGKARCKGAQTKA